MRWRLAASGEPPLRSIRRLRRTLERVTPVVERRLGGPARPDPGLRAVRRRVHGARASADLLIGLILRSELQGPEVRRLLACLRRFRGPFAVLVPQPDPAPPDRLVPARTSVRAA
jgi:hypothetical protein